jgi:hypothetical protein
VGAAAGIGPRAHWIGGRGEGKRDDRMRDCTIGLKLVSLVSGNYWANSVPASSTKPTFAHRMAGFTLSGPCRSP